MIDRVQLTTNRFTTDLDTEIDPALRSFILTEVEIYETAMRDNQDGTFNKIFKAKVVGATEVRQGGKVVKGKSKRSNSKRLHGKLHYDAKEENVDGDEFYDQFMEKLIPNTQAVWQFIKNL